MADFNFFSMADTYGRGLRDAREEQNARIQNALLGEQLTEHTEKRARSAAVRNALIGADFSSPEGMRSAATAVSPHDPQFGMQLGMHASDSEAKSAKAAADRAKAAQEARAGHLKTLELTAKYVSPLITGGRLSDAQALTADLESKGIRPPGGNWNLPIDDNGVADWARRIVQQDMSAKDALARNTPNPMAVNLGGQTALIDQNNPTGGPIATMQHTSAPAPVSEFERLLQTQSPGDQSRLVAGRLAGMGNMPTEAMAAQQNFTAGQQRVIDSASAGPVSYNLGGNVATPYAPGQRGQQAGSGLRAPSGYAPYQAGQPAQRQGGIQVQQVIGPDGKPLGPKPEEVPASIRERMAGNEVALAKVDRAMDLLKGNPNSVGLPYGALPDAISQRVNPQGVELRALISDIAGGKIHDRSGAAVTVGEMARLKPYIPNVSDSPATIQKKLQLFRQEYAAVQADLAAGKGIADVVRTRSAGNANRSGPNLITNQGSQPASSNSLDRFFTQ